MTIGTCILIFALMLLPVVACMVNTSEPYHAAIEYLKVDSTIKDETGNVKGFGFISTGSVQTITINGVESGNATFEIIVKGDKNYKDVTIDLAKFPDSSWSVTYLR